MTSPDPRTQPLRDAIARQNAAKEAAQDAAKEIAARRSEAANEEGIETLES